MLSKMFLFVLYVGKKLILGNLEGHKTVLGNSVRSSQQITW